MNLQLYEPKEWDHTCPDTRDSFLDLYYTRTTKTTVCKFNRRGTLLAVGCNDGRVAVFDFDTKLVSRMWEVHKKQVTSLSWSHNGKKLVSTSKNGELVVIDILSEKMNSYTFSGATYAQFHPKNDDILLVCSAKETPQLFRLSTATRTSLPVETGKGRKDTCVGCFDKQGKNLFIGTGKGKLYHLVNIDTNEEVKVENSTTVPTGGIRMMQISKTGSFLLVNSTTTLRVYFLPSLVHANNFYDVVEKCSCSSCCFSGLSLFTPEQGLDSEYVVGTFGNKITIWNRVTGKIEQILETRHTILDITWHPIRCIVAACAGSGVILWVKSFTERWSAFAPEFTELEQNEFYIEQEDEFDEEFIEAQNLKNENANVEEDKEVDILSVEKGPFSSDDNESDSLYFLPANPIPDSELPPPPVTYDNNTNEKRKKKKKKKKKSNNTTKSKHNVNKISKQKKEQKQPKQMPKTQDQNGNISTLMKEEEEMLSMSSSEDDQDWMELEKQRSENLNMGNTGPVPMEGVEQEFSKINGVDSRLSHKRRRVVDDEEEEQNYWNEEKNF